MPITDRHAIATGTIPGDHADPFDRLLPAQVATEQMILMTRDRKLEPYAALVRMV